jgi:hypothetical protein
MDDQDRYVRAPGQVEEIGTAVHAIEPTGDKAYRGMPGACQRASLYTCLCAILRTMRALTRYLNNIIERETFSDTSDRQLISGRRKDSISLFSAQTLSRTSESGSPVPCLGSGRREIEHRRVCVDVEIGSRAPRPHAKANKEAARRNCG